MSTRETVQGYFGALKQKQGWESFLADDMTFTSLTSPVKQVSGKAAYLETTKRFYGSIERMELRKLIVEGKNACAVTRVFRPPGGRRYRMPVSKSRWTTVKAPALTLTCLTWADGSMIGASEPGMTR